ncbi:hypothetical protein Landi51_08922 [Colletotrichum acutatum]
MILKTYATWSKKIRVYGSFKTASTLYGSKLPRGSVPHTKSSTASAPELRPATWDPPFSMTNSMDGLHSYGLLMPSSKRGAFYSGSFQLQHAVASFARHRNTPNKAPLFVVSFPRSQRDGTRASVFKTLRRTSERNQIVT